MTAVELSVFDSMSVSAGQGLLVQYAAELANAGPTHQELIRRLKEASESVQIFAMIGNLLYAVKGGRLSGFAKKIADWFKVTPILHILLNRKIKVVGIIRTKNKVTKQFAKKVLSKMDPEKHYRIGLIHCETPEEGQKLLELMTFNSPNIESSFLVNCGVTIGSHAGPGTLGVSFMEVKK
jgi:DegV family protein with EDD domain